MAETSASFTPYHLRRLSGWLLFDSLIILLSYSAAWNIRATTANLNVDAPALMFTLLAAGGNIGCLYYFGVYRRIWSHTSGHDVTTIVNAFFLATSLLVLADILLGNPRPLPLSVVLAGNVFSLMGFVAVRYRSRLLSGLSWRWRAIWLAKFPSTPPAQRVLIIGAGESGQAVAWRLRHSHNAKQNYEIIGFVDDDPKKHHLYLEGCPVLGSHQDIELFAASHRIDLIIVAIHNIEGANLREIITQCEQTSARIKIQPNMLEDVKTIRNTPLLRDVSIEDYIGRQAVTKHEAVDFSALLDKVVLVTGAAGSIGSELARQLLDYTPHQLILLDINESGLHDLVVEIQTILRTAKKNIYIIPVLGDITQYNTLNHLFGKYKPHVIFHAAAYKHVPMLEYFPHEAVRVNITGTLNLTQLARQHEVERFVMVSTDKAVEPKSVMGASKRVCELVVMAVGQATPAENHYTAVRFGNVLGSRGSVVPTFARQIEQGGPVTVTDRNMMRYFMSIQEAANLVIHAACLTQGNELFMLKMGEEVGILDLAERMIRMRGLRPYQDIDIVFTGARPGEKMREELAQHTEASQATLHPSIIRLLDPHEQHADFIEHVQNLIISSETDSATPIIERLTQFIQQYSPQPTMMEK